METLRGVFPPPKVPPKRNFLKENVKNVKVLEKSINLLKQSDSMDYLKSASTTTTTTMPPTTGGATSKMMPVKPHNRSKSSRTFRSKSTMNFVKNSKTAREIGNIGDNRIDSKRHIRDSSGLTTTASVTKSVSLSSLQQPANGQQVPHRSRSKTSMKTNNAATESRPTSEFRDASSQTTDVNYDLFLKDVIIRLPSASVLESIKHNKQLECTDELALNLDELKDSIADTVTTSPPDKKSVSNKNSNANTDNDNDNIGLKQVVKKRKNPDEFLIVRNNQIDQLRQYLDNGLLTRKQLKPNKLEELTDDDVKFMIDFHSKRFSKTEQLSQADAFNDDYYQDYIINQDVIDQTPSHESSIESYPRLKRSQIIEQANFSTDKIGSDSTQPKQFNSMSSAISNSDMSDSKMTSNKIQLSRPSSKFELPASYRIGELPKYLQEMKEKTAQDILKQSLMDPQCPPGHVVLSEEHRLEALAIADKKFNELIDELNRMPLTSESLRIKQRKIEIEKELNKLEESIRIFSRQKVYVKID